MAGKVFIVGAGCGDPELLTLKAYRLLQKADVVFYDTLTAEAIREYIPMNAELFDVGKRPYGGGETHFPQEEIHHLMILHARQGKTVVRLKGGDPGVFGRLGEELDALFKASIAVEVIPGVSSILAAPIALNIPLTHRQRSSGFVVITGHEAPDKPSNSINWKLMAENLKSGLTLVLLMGVKNIGKITETLIRHGVNPELPAAAIQEAWTIKERKYYGVITQLPILVITEKISAPAIFVLGDVVYCAQNKLCPYE